MFYHRIKVRITLCWFVDPQLARKIPLQHIRANRFAFNLWPICGTQDFCCTFCPSIPKLWFWDKPHSVSGFYAGRISDKISQVDSRLSYLWQKMCNLCSCEADSSGWRKQMQRPLLPFLSPPWWCGHSPLPHSIKRRWWGSHSCTCEVLLQENTEILYFNYSDYSLHSGLLLVIKQFYDRKTTLFWCMQSIDLWFNIPPFTFYNSVIRMCSMGHSEERMLYK